MPASRFISDKFLPERAKRERRKEARPGELLEAALDLFVDRRFPEPGAELTRETSETSHGKSR